MLKISSISFKLIQTCFKQNGIYGTILILSELVKKCYNQIQMSRYNHKNVFLQIWPRKNRWFNVILISGRIKNSNAQTEWFKSTRNLSVIKQTMSIWFLFSLPPRRHKLRDVNPNALFITPRSLATYARLQFSLQSERAGLWFFRGDKMFISRLKKRKANARALMKDDFPRARRTNSLVKQCSGWDINVLYIYGTA